MAKRILVVDDEPDVRNAWARSLRIEKYAVETAANATEALQKVANHAFDLVILDFIMPGKSGLQLLNEIRKVLPTVRSIIVSGRVDPALEEAGIADTLKAKLEADAFFQKPVSDERLLEAVETLFALAREHHSWQHVAERELNAGKRKKDVRAVEQELKQKKPSRGRPK